jgi:ABC-type sugar transport system substrate-binding protein
MIGTRRLAGLAMVAMVAVAACNSGGASSAPSTAATTGPTTAPSTGGATTGPTTAPSTGGATIKLGFITKFPVDFYDIMVDAVKTWAKDHPEVEVLYAQGKSGTDDEGEIAAIESMMSQGVKGIAITPTSPNLQTELQKAVDAGIKVVLVDNDIPNWAGKSSVVATDNLAGGKLAGTFLAAHLKAGAKLAILQGVLGAPSLDARVSGMLDTLGTAATVVAKTATDCDETKGLNAAQDILTANPNLDALYAACGPPTTGALKAIDNAKVPAGQITVVGFDASSGEIDAIIAGKELGSVAQFPNKMGSLGIQTLLDAVNGKTVSANVDTGTEMVTKDNAASFK